MAVVTIPWLTACALSSAGTLDPGGINGGYVAQMPRSADGRPSGFAAPLRNNSGTAPVRLVSVSLVAAHGLQLLAAYTLSDANELVNGGWIPPLAADDGGVPVSADWPDGPANWETRVALTDSVVAPGESRQLLLVIQATSDDDCLYAEGFTITYSESGRLFSVTSDGAPMIYYHHPESDVNQCDAIGDQILADQAERRAA